MPWTKKAAYFGRKEKLKKLAELMSVKRLLHHIGYPFKAGIKTRKCAKPRQGALHIRGLPEERGGRRGIIRR
jgi:hypothetical protein